MKVRIEETSCQCFESTNVRAVGGVLAEADCAEYPRVELVVNACGNLT